MEKFMYLFIEDGTKIGNASPDEMQADMKKWFEWIEQLKKNDRYVSGEPLLPEGKIVKGKSKTVTDGPFTESKELVSGFFIVNAKDINEATQLSKDCPIFESGGAVAVRPIQKY